MTQNTDSGKVPQTIDSNGNIVPKPNGVSRWARPRFYPCEHPNTECDNAAVVYSPYYKHNCCAQHGKEWGLE